MELPKGWAQVALEQLGIISSGKTPKPAELFSEGMYPYYKVADMNTIGNEKYMIYTKSFLPTTYAGRVFPPNTIVFPKNGGAVLTNKKRILKKHSLVDLNTGAYTPFTDLCFDYVFYLFSTVDFRKLYKGSALPTIDSNLVNNLIFPLPPLAEQHRIVAKIDALFSKLDKGVETLQTIRQQLRIYRQAVLKWAFEGRLTNENIYKYCRLQDLCYFITKGTTPKKDKMLSDYGDVPFIKVYNLTFSGMLDFTIDPTFVSYDTHNGFLLRSKVLPGDVLMNIVGPPLGKVSIVPYTFDEFNINQAIARFRCKKELNNRFLAHFLLFDGTIETISKKSKATAGQFNLTLEVCRDIELPLPNIDEQIKIVAKIESRLSVCDKLEQIVDENLSKAQALKQSILKKAFAGQLVPQDPNDEPAEALLKRIKNTQSMKRK